MYEVKLDAFNGPLDLLLHLIQKFEIDIYDIPMKSLTEQYMQYIHAMNQLEINVASEYLVMASELLMIKSKLLLYSKHPTDLSHLESNEQWDESQTIDLTELIMAYQKVKNRVDYQKPKSVNIHKETFTIQQATAKVNERLIKEDSFNFFSLFTFNEPIEMVVTHFLAILEMSKTGWVNIEQTRSFEDINICRGVNYRLEAN